MRQKIHIISFQVPYPANYGGVIDVFYKLQALKNLGCHITLHTFRYNREEQELLNTVADKVYYYTRKTGLLSNLSLQPYIVFSRRNKQLLHNLQRDHAPILFEGLYSCYLLDAPELKNRQKLVRTHNIEHDYYNLLAKTKGPVWKKLYYRIEAWRLRRFESKLKYAQKILAITEKDRNYFNRNFPDQECTLIPCFHNGKISHTENTKQDEYILYQGNLAVEENLNAIYYLIDKVVPLTSPSVRWIIAGANPPASLYASVAAHTQISIIKNPSDRKMDQLIAQAKANILITFQSTGIKLKLLHALYKGKHCIVNSCMIESTGLESLCLVADTPHGLAKAIDKALTSDFSATERNIRQTILEQLYSNQRNAETLIATIWEIPETQSTSNPLSRIDNQRGVLVN